MNDTLHQPPVLEPTRDGGVELAPVSAGERLVVLDVLRGLAIFGVVISNMQWFSGVVFRFPAYRAELQGLSLDSVAYRAVGILVSGKAIATLSFLFGLGFSMQMLRARARGLSAHRLYYRRLGVMLLLGLVHTIVLWYGDILTLYALLGFLLVAFARRSDRAVLVSAGILLVALPLTLGIVMTVVTASSGAPPAGPSRAEVNAATLAVFQRGSYPQIVRENIVQALQFFRGAQGIAQLQYLGLFLLGLYIGRRRVFERVDQYRPMLRRVAVWGLAIGLCCSILQETIAIVVGRRAAFARADLVLLMTMLAIGPMVQAAGYVAAVTLLLQRPFWERWLGMFAPAGRMALTNYLTQTVLCLAVFYGFGGALIGRTGPALGLGIGVTIIATQIVWSRLWLLRFRMGPLEWVWRSGAYGRLQPMRRAGGEGSPRPSPSYSSSGSGV